MKMNSSKYFITILICTAQVICAAEITEIRPEDKFFVLTEVKNLMINTEYYTKSTIEDAVLKFEKCFFIKYKFNNYAYPPINGETILYEDILKQGRVLVRWDSQVAKDISKVHLKFDSQAKKTINGYELFLQMARNLNAELSFLSNGQIAFIRHRPIRLVERDRVLKWEDTATPSTWVPVANLEQQNQLEKYLEKITVKHINAKEYKLKEVLFFCEKAYQEYRRKHPDKDQMPDNLFEYNAPEQLLQQKIEFTINPIPETQNLSMLVALCFFTSDGLDMVVGKDCRIIITKSTGKQNAKGWFWDKGYER